MPYKQPFPLQQGLEYMSTAYKNATCTILPEVTALQMSNVAPLLPGLVNFLFLIEADLARTHIDKEEESATVWIVNVERMSGQGLETYTMESIWKKSYLAKSFCG